jgi:Mn-dependent DtxR family transcriptional regulator
VVVELAAALRNPPATVDEVIERLARNGLAQSMAKIRELRGDT